MLRSAATPNRTEVQSSSEMKQTTIRRILPTPQRRSALAAPQPRPQIRPKLIFRVRLFKV
jgi:hypothetical protein